MRVFPYHKVVHCRDRRKFLRLLGWNSLGLLGLGVRGTKAESTHPLPLFSQSSEPVALAVLPKGASEGDAQYAIRRVAEAVTDFSWLSRGDRVFVKPAANSAHPYPAVTSPSAVYGLVRLLLEKGAGKVIVGDKPGVESVYQDEKRQWGSSREVLGKNGLYRATVEAGGEPHYFDEAGYDAYFGDRTEHESHWKGELMLPAVLDRVDHVVLLPRVSRHVLAGTTLGLKAAVGWLRDDSRLELHRDAESFLEKTAEINDAKVLKSKLRLVFTVATKVQTTFGPDKGFCAYPDPGLIFASNSLLAHDRVALGWLLWNRDFATPKGNLVWYRDPYVTFPGLINRLFVAYIWGAGQLLGSGSYTGPPIRSAGTDRVLSRAGRIWGGLPKIHLETVTGKVPESIARYILKSSV